MMWIALLVVVVVVLTPLLRWYFGREPEGSPPDESDYLHRDELPDPLEESSTSFDLPDLVPFLQRFLPLVSGGYNAKVIDHMADLSARMKHNQERSLEYQVIYEGQRMALSIGLFKDDAEAVSIYFRTGKSLAAAIDAEMEAFFEERGM